MRTATRRATTRLSVLTLAIAVLLTASGSSIAIGGRLAPEGRPAGAQGAAVPAGSIVRIDVTGAEDDGTAVNRSGYGVVVDSSGLVLAAANLVAPKAPGVAVSWGWPFLGFNILQILVSTSTAPGQPFAPAYAGTVVAADGFLDVAVLKLDFTLDATGGLVPVPAGSLNLPAVPLATSAPAAGTSVVFATYAETGETPTGLGAYAELPGLVTGYGGDDAHAPDQGLWIQTDIATPVALPGGPIVDTTGSLVGVAQWLPQAVPGSVVGASAPLIAPVIAAAKSGSDYNSPYIEAGTGLEVSSFTGWSTTDPACPPTNPVATYPTGTTRIAATFQYSGWTDNEDYMVFWFDPDQQQILVTNLTQWTFGAEGQCYANSISAGGSPLPDGTYVINVFAGGDLHGVAGAKTTIGQPAAGAVKVTGRVLDADTGNPVLFAIIYILKPGVDPQAWFQNGSQADVASTGLTDDTGTYITDPPIVPGQYPFVVVPFDAHQTIGGTLTVPPDGKLPDILLVATE